MIFRTIAILGMVFIVSACTGDDAKTDEGMINVETREDISDGPLNGQDMYAMDSQGLENEGPAPGSQQDLVVNVGDRVFFGYDQYNLTPEAQRTLELQAEWMKRYTSTTITIAGHADERGTREYNLALGDRRANSVKNYLVALGIDPRRVTTISYGKERPAVLGSNPSAWAQNRRGVTTVD